MENADSSSHSGVAAVGPEPWSCSSRREQKVLKYAHFQPARADQPKHAAALAFKELRRESDQRLHQGRDLPGRPIRK